MKTFIKTAACLVAGALMLSNKNNNVAARHIILHKSNLIDPDIYFAPLTKENNQTINTNSIPRYIPHFIEIKKNDKVIKNINFEFKEDFNNIINEIIKSVFIFSMSAITIMNCVSVCFFVADNHFHNEEDDDEPTLLTLTSININKYDEAILNNNSIFSTNV